MFVFLAENPKTFIIEVLQRLQKSKSTQFDLPCLFDESNIVSIFGMLDPTGRGFISHKQYQEGVYSCVCVCVCVCKRERERDKRRARDSAFFLNGEILAQTPTVMCAFATLLLQPKETDRQTGKQTDR